jgi:hypothetical protein
VVASRCCNFCTGQQSCFERFWAISTNLRFMIWAALLLSPQPLETPEVGLVIQQGDRMFMFQDRHRVAAAISKVPFGRVTFIRDGETTAAESGAPSMQSLMHDHLGLILKVRRWMSCTTSYFTGSRKKGAEINSTGGE